MRWQGREKSKNVEDRRGRSGAGTAGGLGIGAIIIVLIASFFFDVDLSGLFDSGAATQQYQQPTQGSRSQVGGEGDELGEFVAVTLKDTEDVWTKIFREDLGRNYREPTLVLFEGAVQSACGHTSSAAGPFYCPGDEKLYIDLVFYRELKTKFNAPGDFAMAYVVAHEVAHHIQRQLGITEQVQQQRGRISQEKYNDLSVRMELQADFLAGVWTHHAEKMKGILEQGDIEEALRAANAIGDDTIQKRAQGYVVPDSFTHGTSEQRVRWFMKGLETGEIAQGDTFAARTL
jgi:predicted metalloprotease